MAQFLRRLFRRPTPPPLFQMWGQGAYYCVACRWICEGTTNGRCRKCQSNRAIPIEALVKRELAIIERRVRARLEEGLKK